MLNKFEVDSHRRHMNMYRSNYIMWKELIPTSMTKEGRLRRTKYAQEAKRDMIKHVDALTVHFYGTTPLQYTLPF